ncbi:MAG: hypothetical protein LBR29_10330, partial [Methylobacteriaceae bacterium]|nr:hypothetical protein [Methylobacteriaceae bacterium]
EIFEQPYKPVLSWEGKRHPVTRNLPGSERAPPSWGEWLRQIGAQKTQGVTLLSGYRDLPLLILNRVNQGRSALILSDHPWLWARGYRGGGPHADLLRRIAHWLMKEPALEEEALRASIQNATLTIERQSMGDAVGDVTVTAPDGTGTVVRLSAKQPGLFEASVAVSLQGIYTLASDGLTAFASFGPGHNKELEDVFSNTELLQAPARHTGGVVLRVGVSPGVAPVVPKLRSVGPNTRAFGNGWIGLRASGESVIHGMQVFPLGLGFAALLLFMAATVTTWLVESRRRSNPSA